MATDPLSKLNHWERSTLASAVSAQLEGRRAARKYAEACGSGYEPPNDEATLADLLMRLGVSEELAL